MQKKVAFVVGHESWGKSCTLRALIDICQGQGRRVTISGCEFLLRMMSNDDWPESYHDFMNSTRRPYLIAALCPKFKKLRRDDDPRKEIDATLQALQERGYRLYFWVIERKWGDQASVVGRDELSELRRYGTVEVFAGQDVESDQRARRFRSFVSDVVLP